MPDRDAKKLERQLDRISAELPSRVGGFLRWLRGPSSRWVRVPAGLLLIIGGVVGFLPVLGFWMVPLGALLLAQDIPFLRRPVLQLLAWLEREWIKWKSQRSRGGGKAMKPFYDCHTYYFGVGSYCACVAGADGLERHRERLQHPHVGERGRCRYFCWISNRTLARNERVSRKGSAAREVWVRPKSGHESHSNECRSGASAPTATSSSIGC